MSKTKLTDSEIKKITDLEEKAEVLYDDEKYKEAIALYRIAAELGGDYSQYSLGYCYQNGIGVQENLEEAIKWYKKAADNGNEQALSDIAMCLYDNGSYLDSFQWFDKAKDAGFDDAWYYLGWLYFTGEGPEDDEQKAKECWGKVIGNNQGDLQHDIGYLYYLNNHHEEALFWFKMSAKHGNESAKQWINEGNQSPDEEICEVDGNTATEFWEAMRIEVDAKSGLVFNPAQDYSQLSITSNEYLIEGNYYKFTLTDSETLSVCLIVNTSNPMVNEKLSEAFCEYLSSESDIQAEITEIANTGKSLNFEIECLSLSGTEECKKSAKLVTSVISSIEYGISDIENDYVLPWSVYKIEPAGKKRITIIDTYLNKVKHEMGFRFGFIIIKANAGIRDNITTHFEDEEAETNFSEDYDIIDYSTEDSWFDDWRATDNKDHQIAKLILEDDIEGALEEIGLEVSDSSIWISGELEITFIGFNKSEESQSEDDNMPERNNDLDPNSGTISSKNSEEISTRGSYLDFWITLKPYLEQLKFKGFAEANIKDSESLNCKKGILAGVYHSLGIIKTKKKIRLECYIDTGNETRNLLIIDYVKANIKLGKSIKDKLIFDRKEGRNAQKISLFLDNFELDDRGCWSHYIDEIVAIMDEFVIAIDSCLKQL